MLLAGTFEPATVQSRLQAALSYVPDSGEYLGAHVDQAYDRTTTARVAEEMGITHAEKADGTWDEAYTLGQATQEFTGPFAGMTPPDHRFTMTEEEWKNSEYHIPTAKFRPDMTVTRARIMKENYDQRCYLESLVSRGDESYGLSMKALGFGASLVGSLPDPVNFIPFAGGMKAASVGRGMAKGALEGAVGNAAVDALVLPDLAAKGEDVGFADAMMDTAFGALLGGALGGLGGYLGKRLEARRGGDRLPRHEDADMLRASLEAGDRATVMQAAEKAMADIHADRPVDVSDIFMNTPTITKAQYQHFVSQLEQADEFTNVRFGKLRPDLRDALNSIRADEGVVLLDGDDLIIPANVVKKLHEKRVLEGKMSADEVGQLLLDVFHRDADFASTTKFPHIQAVVALRDTLSRVGFISTNPKTGEVIIKSGYKKETPRLMRELGGGGSNSGGARNPSSDDGIETPPFAAPRLSALQSGEPVAKIIDAPRSEVNASVERPDAFTPAPALREEIPEFSPSLHEEMGLDPTTGLLPEESLVNELDAAGRVAPEDRDALLVAQQEATRAPEYDDIGQGLIPCILEVSDGK